MQNNSGATCIQGKQASFICVTQMCNNDAFICSDETCKCKSNHIKCQHIKEIKQLIEKLFEKGKGTQRSINKFAVISKLYQNLVSQIVLDQEEMKHKNPLLGLEQHQFQFDQIVKGVKKGQLSGDAASAVMFSLNKMPFSIFQQITNDQSFLKMLETQFEQTLLKLRTLWKFKVQHDQRSSINSQLQKVKQTERQLKQFLKSKTYWLQINGKQAQTGNILTDLKTITGIGFDQCNKNIIELLGTHCKNLKNLGIKSQNQKFGDDQAEIIARNLKNLTHLHLYNHEIGDKGAIAIAHNLKDLVGLYLYGNKLTNEGQEEVANLLPKCAEHISEPK